MKMLYTCSSEDELDILLHGTPEQKRKLCRLGSNQQEESSSEDDFEKEMNAELDGTLKAIEKRRRSALGTVYRGLHFMFFFPYIPAKFLAGT